MRLTPQLLSVTDVHVASCACEMGILRVGLTQKSLRACRAPGHSVEPNLSDEHDRNGRGEDRPDKDAGHVRDCCRRQNNDQGHTTTRVTRIPSAPIAKADVTRETIGPCTPVGSISDPRSKSITAPPPSVGGTAADARR